MKRRACVAMVAVAIFGLFVGCTANPYRPALFRKNNEMVAGPELGAPTSDGPYLQQGDMPPGMMVGQPGPYGQGPPAINTLPPVNQPATTPIPSFPPQVPQGPPPVPQGPAPKAQPPVNSASQTGS